MPFQSYNVEMAEVIGARILEALCSHVDDEPPPAEIQVGRDPNLFEARPPADLSNRRLRHSKQPTGPPCVRAGKRHLGQFGLFQMTMRRPWRPRRTAYSGV